MRPNLHVLLVGSDGTAYGPGRSDGMTWTDWALQNVQLDPLGRTDGPLGETEYHQVLAVTSIYISRFHLFSVGVCLKQWLLEFQSCLAVHHQFWRF